MLKHRLKGSLFGKRIFHFFRTDSTNRVALELGHAGEAEGAVVLAEEQTAGRGRGGRAWHSERAAGIYVTLLLRPKLAPVQAPLLTMMAGLSAHSAVQALTGLDVDLKWPRSEEHTSELQSRRDLVCRLLLEKKKKKSTLEIVCR